MIRIFLAFITAVVTTHVLTSVIGTQFVLADIQSYGIAVSLSDRVVATWHDVYGLVPTLPILITAAFLVAFVVAALGNRFLGGDRRFWYLVAGLTSLPAAMLLIKSTMGITPFAAAGTASGMLLISVCGMVGGFLFSGLTLKKGV